MKVHVDCTVQFMMKSKDRDIPRMLPLQNFSGDGYINVHEDLLPYIDIYRKNLDIIAGNELHGTDNPCVPYNPPRDLVKKWRKKVRKEVRTHNSDVKDVFVLGDDDVIEQAIVLVVEYGIDDMLTDTFIDKALAESGIKIPDDTETERYADRFVKVKSWMAC